MRNVFGFSFCILLMLVVFASCSKEETTLIPEGQNTEISSDENAGKKASPKEFIVVNKIIINSDWVTLTYEEYDELELGSQSVCLIGNCSSSPGPEVLQCFDLSGNLEYDNLTDNTIDVRISDLQHIYTGSSEVMGCYGGELYVTYKDECGCIIEQFDFPPSSGFEDPQYVTVDLASLLGPCTALC